MTALQKIEKQISIFSQEQKDLVKTTICRGATDDEFRLFMGIAERTKLDPFSRQIYFVKRWDSNLRKEVGTAQFSIDAFRIIAERSKEYKGQLDTLWYDGEEKEWVDVWLKDAPPAAAKARILRKGFDHPVTAIARWKTYAQTTKSGKLNHFWEKMDDLMIAKCAEAAALRKAFPNDLSGLYTNDEIEQAVIVDVSPEIANKSEIKESKKTEIIEMRQDTKPAKIIKDHEKYPQILEAIEMYQLEDKMKEITKGQNWHEFDIARFEGLWDVVSGIIFKDKK